MLSFTKPKKGRPIARLDKIKKKSKDKDENKEEKKKKKKSKKKDVILYFSDDKNIKNPIESFDVPAGHVFQIIPNEKVAEHIYISAVSGAGKSTWASNYIKEYKKLKEFKKDDIYLLSNVQEDAVLDKLKDIKRIKLNSDIITDPIHPSELENAIIIFDDAENIPNKLIKNAVQTLRASCLEESRHYNSRILICNHIAMAGASTRPCINEARIFVMFIKHSSPYYLNRYLKEYVGLGKKLRKKLLSLEARWVAIFRIEKVAIYENGAMILKVDLDDF